MKIILFTVLSLLLYSCQKEINFEDEIPTTPVSLDTTLLLKTFVVIDTTLAAPNDIVFKYTFAYDNLKRCTSFKATNGFDSFAVFNNFIGNDTFITTRRIYDFSSGDSTIHYLTYSSAGKILSDSIIEFSPSLTIFFVDYQNTSNQNGTITVRSNGAQFEYNKFLTTRGSNNNLLNVKDSLFVLRGTNYVLTETANSNITYDTKINPFYKVVPDFLVNVQLEASSIFTFIPFQSLPQKNNILSESKIFNPLTSGLDNVNNTYQYVYNAHNYPTIVRVRDILNNIYWKGIYVY